MDRRSFLRSSAVAVATLPAVPASAVAMCKPDGIRMSSDKNDAGYRAWCEANGDGMAVKVYLDGVLQRDAVTADEAEGSVYRAARTPAGNFARSADEILHETVYGDVRIVIA